jgi:anti-sigma B factor antagonist
VRVSPGYARAVELAGEVTVEHPADGVAVITLQGEHDLGTVSDVRDALVAAAESAHGIVIDLSPTAFVDSSILGVILEARREAEEGNRAFAVGCDGGAEAVRRVLEVTGLKDELPVHPDRATAIESLGSRETS